MVGGGPVGAPPRSGTGGCRTPFPAGAVGPGRGLRRKTRLAPPGPRRPGREAPRLASGPASGRTGRRRPRARPRRRPGRARRVGDPGRLAPRLRRPVGAPPLRRRAHPVDADRDRVRPRDGLRAAVPGGARHPATGLPAGPLPGPGPVSAGRLPRRPAHRAEPAPMRPGGGSRRPR
ncbi:hypothetical protein BKD26_36365 [Streptomyces sp. CB03238]|nr:hypothetical protein BKD26_36365 [Streptomyces sp. CB03238]